MKRLVFVLSLLLLLPSCEKIGEVDDMLTLLEGHYVAMDQPNYFSTNSDMPFDASVQRSGRRWYLERYYKTPKGEPVSFQNELTWNKVLNRYLIEDGVLGASTENHHFETEYPFAFDPKTGIMTVVATRYRKID